MRRARGRGARIRGGRAGHGRGRGRGAGRGRRRQEAEEERALQLQNIRDARRNRLIVSFAKIGIGVTACVRACVNTHIFVCKDRLLHVCILIFMLHSVHIRIRFYLHT